MPFAELCGNPDVPVATTGIDEELTGRAVVIGRSGVVALAMVVGMLDDEATVVVMLALYEGTLELGKVEDVALALLLGTPELGP